MSHFSKSHDDIVFLPSFGAENLDAKLSSEFDFWKSFSRVFFDRILKLPIGLQDLKDYMRQAGEVTYADAHKQHRNEG